MSDSSGAERRSVGASGQPVYVWRERVLSLARNGEKLSPTALALAFAIGECAHHTSLECYPGEQRLADDLGVATRTVRRAKRELIESRVVEERKQAQPAAGLASVLVLTPDKMPPRHGTPVSPKGAVAEDISGSHRGQKVSSVEDGDVPPTSHGTSHRTSSPGLTASPLPSVAALPPGGGVEVEKGKGSDDLLSTDPGPFAAASPEGAKPPDDPDRHNVVMPGWTPPTRAEPPAPPAARRIRHFRHEG